MSRKVIIFLTIDAIIIIGAIIANSIIGSKVAQSVDEQLQIIFKENATTAPFDFEYDKVTASPIGRSVTISGFKATGGELPVDLTAKAVKLKMPFSEILALAGDRELKSINKMSIDMQEPLLSADDTEASFQAKSMKLSFDGEVSLFELERTKDGLLPSTRQSIDINCQDMRFDGLQEMLADFSPQVPVDIGSFGNQFEQSGNFRLSVDYDPDAKQIHLKRIESSSESIDFNANALFNFMGESIEDFEPKDAHIEARYNVNKLKQSYLEFGEYEVRKADVAFEMDLNFDKPTDDLSSGLLSVLPIENMSYDIEIKDISFEPTEELSSMMNQPNIPVQIQDIKLNDMTLDFKMDGKVMRLDALSLDIDDMIKLDAKAKMSYQTMPNAGLFGEDAEVLVFDNAHIELAPLSDEIKELVQMMEESMPKPFPRQGNKIIIDLSGPVNNPDIKGVTN